MRVRFFAYFCRAGHVQNSMTNDKHFDPVIHAHLQRYVGQQDWEGLVRYLKTLSNAHFRTAGYLLGERLFPSLREDEAWAMGTALVTYHPKAFYVTVLKAVSKGLIEGSLHLHSNGSKTFLDGAKRNPLDAQKTLLQLLPVMVKPEDVLWLFRRLEVEEGEPRLPYLMRTSTLPTAYVLFRTLKYVEHDYDLLVRVAYFLMKKKDGLSFNLASLLKVYYGLERVKGTFSLRLEPYQLARIENSYEAFCEAMRC